MAINQRGNGLAYKTDTADGVSIYEMKVKNVVVFEVGIFNTDAELKIRIRKPGDTDWLITNGKAAKTADSGDYIDGLTVQSYVYPRLPEMMFDLWVIPQLPEVTGTEVPDTFPTDWLDGPKDV